MENIVSVLDTLRLVKYRGEWLIAQRGQYPSMDGIADAWLCGKEMTFLCWIGHEDISYVLPDWQTTNFFGDRFSYAIDRQYDFEKKPERWAALSMR